ncbi:MAG: SMC-Scp complex subunit ScpB [Rhizobacter sp.]|nr:SMC-Scp complex subunit ScpB [Chlorobiales bacterium]
MHEAAPVATLAETAHGVSTGETHASEVIANEPGSDETGEDEADALDLGQQLEAVIFASDETLNIKAIRTALGLTSKVLSEHELDRLVAKLNADYESTGRTFRIHRIAEGYRFLTEKQFHGVVQNLLQPKLLRRLSQSALETLAIISYKQPISKSDIEAIRGVGADYVIRVLLEKNLIEVSGRSENVGKPLLYGTTNNFLDYFNLHSLADLPKPREIQELMKDGDAQEQLKSELMSRLTLEIEDDAETAAPNAAL